MTRIIGGIAGSRQLASPAKSTRPTSDRIREAIFNRLEARDMVDNKRVLDLYAGTGALALEAISRGAIFAMMVERDGKAAAVCVKNTQMIQKAMEKEGFYDQVTKVANKAVSSFLSTDVLEYDVVFIDPPYEISNEEVSENLTALVPRLAADAIIMLERSSRSGPVELPAGLELDEEKNYGDTTVFWLTKSE
ncbi:16S rRNA (guanine(966)-N(2))-methyltransferase RsmD [Rhodoluna limnophila]|uniref:16S rRNA (guanine(966)-N(2))-methyltransferase RsmD n=1 Tax=Rhodoluna limnophila TaxID=232537 RepID=UPI001105E5C9|nr:16S rRNA (guanine(966)-N(2))-methyltransferase RsmD [Rhodoluna limnophila]